MQKFFVNFFMFDFRKIPKCFFFYWERCFFFVVPALHLYKTMVPVKTKKALIFLQNPLDKRVGGMVI